ncbi:MAG: hypothetical protein JSV93_03450 [Candidatus Omnitrophota bacterium]|nr:MAG: hypothetical protein JSV93_03450 [Candidatus Omnitrophota bacterium]
MTAQVKLIRNLFLIAIAAPVIILVSPLSVIGEEVVTLTTIVPSQDTLRVERGAIGTSYRQTSTLSDEDIGDNNLLIEGTVGIGTTEPVGELNIYGISGDPGIIFGERTASTWGPYGFLSYSNSYGYIMLGGQDNDHYYSDIILETGQHGNVGISDNSPSARLEVQASGLGDDVFMISSNYVDANGDLLIVKENGRVGIGTTTPNNTIQVEELINFSDNERLTALGYRAGNANTTGGMDNTFIGYQAGYSNSAGDYNTAVGRNSLLDNTTGSSNTAIGYNALENNTTAERNAALGNNALGENTTGSNNAAVGMSSLQWNTNGHDNTAMGYRALYSNTGGDYNTAVGTEALRSNTNVNYNTAMGYQALYNSQGANNTAMGYRALYSNSSGMYNTAVGMSALYSKTIGSYNTAIGDNALRRNTTGAGNIALGKDTAYYNITGSYNVFIGYQAGFAETGSNKLYIDNSGTSTPLIKGDFSANTVRINGSFSKQSGSFDITHPDPQKEKQGWHLRHSFVESPTRGDNLYRWTVELENGHGIIELPDYFRHLNENVQVWVSPKRHFGRAYGEADTGLTKITIKADNDGLYNVLAVGTRKDRYARNAFDELGVEYQDKDNEHF